MHELSIALSIVDVVCGESDRRGGVKVSVVHLRLGQMAGVLKEALLSSWTPAAESTPLAGSRLIIEEVPISIHCPTCKAARPVVSLQDLRCRECLTAAADILTGRELEVIAMEIVP